MDTIGHWLLPHGIGAADLAERLKTTFQTTLAVDERQRLVLFDTFAWHLWRKGLLLCKFDETCALCCLARLSSDEAVVLCNVAGEVPRLWWDWPAGPMREALRSLIEVRALIPLAEVTAVTQRIDLQNRDGKTVSRLVVQRFEQFGECGEQAIGMCRSVPMRGYVQDHTDALRVLQACNFPFSATPPVEMILEQSGHRPEAWPSPSASTMSPQMTVREAIRRLASDSLETCLRCEAGVIDDVDTEFLHDYRVSLRRLRSTLKLIKHVYPADVTARVTADLAQCARQTNRLRDLDVHLLNRDEYIRCTPPDLQDALGEMFEHLQRVRAAEQQIVAAHLGSDACRATMQRLLHVFGANKWWPVTVNSHASVLSLAKQVLPRRYKNICRMHSAISRSASDRQVHDMRLQTKKLRYLLEFFGGLYVSQRMDRLCTQLKKLQNTLGAFNDLAVQQESLQTYVRQQTSVTQGSTDLVLAVGSLLGNLHRQHQELRQAVFRRLASFTADETQSLVQDLFNGWSRAA